MHRRLRATLICCPRRPRSAVEEEECACVVCGGTEKAEAEEAGPQVMLECDHCLSGCHMGCCAPPLQEVPEVRPGGGGGETAGRAVVIDAHAPSRGLLLGWLQLHPS